MTVKELIKELLECDMNLKVYLEVENDENYNFSVTDKFEVINGMVRVVLSDIGDAE